MSVRVTGMKEWLADLETLPERAPKAFKPVLAHAGANIKDDWYARWAAMPHAHLPHLVSIKSFQYETDQKGWTFSVEVGVRSERQQSRLASFIEYGTLTSGPHPAGMPALEAEAPKMAAYAEKHAAELLEGKR